MRREGGRGRGSGGRVGGRLEGKEHEFFFVREVASQSLIRIALLFFSLFIRKRHAGCKSDRVIQEIDQTGLLALFLECFFSIFSNILSCSFCTFDCSF